MPTAAWATTVHVHHTTDTIMTVYDRPCIHPAGEAELQAEAVALLDRVLGWVDGGSGSLGKEGLEGGFTPLCDVPGQGGAGGWVHTVM